MSLPREQVLLLETEDQLEQALGSRQVIEYASQDAATPTDLPSATPIPLSPLFLQESACDMLLAAVPRPESSPPHPSCSYDLCANDYPSGPFLLDSQQTDSNEDNDSPTASPLLTPVPHLLRESYDDSYDMSVRPLIGVETTPFFNLAPVSAASSPHTPPPYILYPLMHLFPAQYARMLMTTKLHSVVIVGKNCLSGILAVYREIGEGGYNM